MTKRGEGGWWRRGARTRYHSYYTPTSNLPGKLLFGAIGALGLAALFVAVLHWSRSDVLTHEDKVLAIVGLLCILLSAWQIRSLSR